jgi:hypothetical protein
MIGVLTTVLEELSRHADQDWGRPAGGLAWSCRETAVHIGHDLLAYAGQVAGRASGGYLPLDLTVRDEASNAQVLDVVRACGMLLIRAVEGAAEADRGWHWGATPGCRTGPAAPASGPCTSPSEASRSAARSARPARRARLSGCRRA